MSKEVGDSIFVARSRSTQPLDVKAKSNSLRMMESLDKAYLMTTNRSPSLIMLSE